MRAIRLGVILWLAAAGLAFGQAPLLTTTAQALPQGWGARLSNVYSAAATAYIIQMTYSTNGNDRKATHWADAIPGPEPSRIAIAPGASRVLPMGSLRWANVAYQVLAVIYADGATAGDAQYVRHLLLVRRAILGDLAEVVPRLSAVASDANADRSSLVAEFQQRAALGRAAVDDHVLHHPVDRVCQTVLVNFENTTQHPNVQRAAAALGSLFTRWQAQLEASRPQLAP